ncbi:MAG: IPT/TIG domain-containing protein [Pseudomonadota bacterium]
MVRISSICFLVCLFFCSCETKPGIKSIEPNFGNVAGGDSVLIHGNGFREGMMVQFGKKQAAGVVINSAAQTINVRTPAGEEGSVDVIVTADDGKSYVLRNGFRYQRGK